MRKHFLLMTLCISVWTYAGTAAADVDAVERQRAGLGANELSDIVFDGDNLWVVGSGSLNKRIWGNGGRYSDWMSYAQEPGFGRGSVGAIMANDDIIILSWLYSDDYGDTIETFGDGFSMSFDRGETWYRSTIVDLFPERATYTYPGFRTITWDFAFSEGTLWATTAYGYLLKSDDLGATWVHVFPNTDTLNIQNPNHHGFSVDAYGDTLWVGTYQGINLSVDRGESWTNISWANDGTDDINNPVPGNFCTAIEHTVIGGKTHVWVASDDYFGAGVTGIFHTSDNGATWDYSNDYKAWNFAFGRKSETNSAVSDSTVFASTETGLIVTHDLGETWSDIVIAEPDSVVRVVDGNETVSYAPGKQWEAGTQVYGLAAISDSLWVTSSDGIAVSADWGESWRIFKGVTRVKTLDEGKRDIGIASAFDETRTYAFPNPFSPKRSDRDYARCRIQYALTADAEITISIHDYSGRVIKDLLDSDIRLGGNEYQEVWDGRDGDGNTVPNGVYFYIIKTNKGDSARGKIMVVD